MDYGNILQFVNLYGLLFLFILMIPNVVYAQKRPEGFENLWHNKPVEIMEQIGRFGCMGFMVAVLPWFNFGFASPKLFAAYLITDGVLLAAYCAVWVLFFNKNCMFRVLALSILPCLLFLASGLLSVYLPLIVSVCIFAPCHVLLSVKNYILQKNKERC